MFDDDKLPPCAIYKSVYDWGINPNFKMKRIKKNIFNTWEGYMIVSEKFKNFCDNEGYNGLEFVPFPLMSQIYWFKVNNIVEYDTKARGTEFLGYSEECDSYAEVIGAIPACLKEKKLLTDGFFRSDVFFGSYNGKDPLIMIGEATKIKLKTAGFKEIYFEKILDKYEWQSKKVD